VGLWVACLRKEHTGTRILRPCAAFQFVFSTGNIVTRLEFGKIRGGIRLGFKGTLVPVPFV
jgi:hypothetical protein